MPTRRSILLLAAASAVPALAATPMTTLRIEVSNDIGKPVDRAGVIVRFVKGRSVVKLGKKIVRSWELRTNSEGWVKIPPLPQGEILVQVIAKNYQTFGGTFEVAEEERTIQIKLQQPQKQFSNHGEMPASPSTEPPKKND